MAERVKKKQLSAEDRQFNRNKWFFSVSGIGRDMSYQLIASFLLTYIQFGTTLSILQFTFISLMIGVAGRVWDAINDPMMGAIIEGTHMKFGKFRPWILIGAVLTGAIIIAMFNVQMLSGWKFVIYMAIMYLLWESAFTMNDIGYWSMLASLSSKKEQRNSATMLTVVFAGVGAFAAQGIISMLYPGRVREAFSIISIVVAVIFMVMQIVMVLVVKERPRALMEVNEKVSLKQMWNTIRHNDQVLWMTLSMLFYNIGSSLLVGLAYNLYYMEIGYDGNAIIFIAIFGVFNIVAQLLYPMLVKKLGRKRLQFWSIIIACIGYAGIALLGWPGIKKVLPFKLWSLSIFGVFVFVGQALFYMASIVNMTNCVEYNEYKRGERNEAVVSTLRPFMAKFADAIKYGIITLVLIVSSVYALSQNISTLEAQKDHFNSIKTVSSKVEYIDAVTDYIVQLDNGTMTQEEATTALGKEEGILKGKQLDGKYIESLKDAALMDATGDKEELVAYLSQMTGEVVVTTEEIDGETVTVYTFGEVKMYSNRQYNLSLTGQDGDGTFNAANANFKNKSNYKMKIWIRASVTIVPVLFLLVAWIIQQKKFVIDEDYYDMMITEIEKRKEQQPTTTEDAIPTEVPVGEVDTPATESSAEEPPKE